MIERIIAFCARNRLLVFMVANIFGLWGLWALRVTPLDAVAEPVTAAVVQRDPMLVSWLRGQVAALPAAARAVVVLRYQRELGPVEIAETLDMPLNTVKSHLKRSLAVLRARCARVRHG